MLTFKRGERRYKADFVLQDLYKFYVEHTKNPVDIKTYKTVLKKFNSGWFKLAIVTGMELNFPFRLGSLRIKKSKRKFKFDETGKLDKSNFAMNYKASKDMWEQKYPNLTAEEILKIPLKERGIKYNYNDHTERYSFKFIWDKRTSNIPNKSWYSFKPLRDYRRLINEEVLNNLELQYLYYE